MSWIAYVTPLPFPWGQAGSRRICGMAQSLAAAGYRVIVGSGDSPSIATTRLSNQGSSQLVSYLGLGELPEQNSSHLEKVYRIFWSWGDRTVKWLDSQGEKPSHVFVYGGSAQYISRLLPWCRRNGVALVVDVVEWYDGTHTPGGTYGPYNLSAKLALKYLYPRCNGIIAISSLLEDYYSHAGCAVIRIPPTTDIEATEFSQGEGKNSGDKLTIIYAGTPGKKDLLGNIIRAAGIVDSLGSSLNLLIAGPTREEVSRLYGGENLPACVNVLGKIKQNEVAGYLRLADFSILIREPIRYANAGFPTKFIESLACGTPVLANLTSDLDLYLHDEIEGLVVAGTEISDIVTSMRRALALTRDQLLMMRKYARQQAEQSFDFRHYSSALAGFVDKIKPKETFSAINSK